MAHSPDPCCLNWIGIIVASRRKCQGPPALSRREHRRPVKRQPEPTKVHESLD